ncbi:MAG: sporulation protein YtxC [Candidatus Caccovivens sp.]
MWELSISVGCKDLEVAKYIYQTLKAQSENYGAVVTCFEQFENIVIMFGCPAENRSHAQVEIERCIIKVICNFFKEKYLTDNLHLPLHESISLMAFKKALINFDKETDFYIISKNLDLEKNLHLDSFYYFKLKPLRDKWSELISLANENSDYLVTSDAFFDLLRFLIDNLEVGEDEINVFEDENGYSIKAKNANEEYKSLSQEGLVSSLIELCPKKINLFCNSDDFTASFLSKIFEERINVCYNKTSLEKIENFSYLK